MNRFHKNNKKRSSLIETLLSADVFQDKVDLNYDGGKKSMKTFSGCALTVIMCLTIFIYGIRQYIHMAERSNVVINTYVNFGEGLKVAMKGYGKDKNFNIAFGIGDFLSSGENQEIFQDYGSINLYYWSWDNEKEEINQIESRPCTRDDFQMNDTPPENPKFFPAFI
jgi:hypothetical protein